jgi:hypothetical protein
LDGERCLGETLGWSTLRGRSRMQQGHTRHTPEVNHRLQPRPLGCVRLSYLKGHGADLRRCGLVPNSGAGAGELKTGSDVDRVGGFRFLLSGRGEDAPSPGGGPCAMPALGHGHVSRGRSSFPDASVHVRTPPRPSGIRRVLLGALQRPPRKP